MKYVDYYVSGVWKHGAELHSLLLHTNTPAGFEGGIKTMLKDVIVLLEKGTIIFAMACYYKTGKWLSISPLETPGDGTIYCKYSEAGIALKHLLNLDFIGHDGNSFLKPMSNPK